MTFRGTMIQSLLGCYGGELYSKNRSFDDATAFVTSVVENITENLERHRTIWQQPPPEYKFGMSFNCFRGGGERITILGHNFGSKEAAIVLIGGKLCTDVIHDQGSPQEQLTCKTPKMGMIDKADVVIKNGFLNGLKDTVPYFIYEIEPPHLSQVKVSNIAARSVDLSWKVGGSLWQQLTYTGFLIEWRPVN